MAETMLEDLYVLRALEPVGGVQRHLCWDRTLDRETWMWRLDAGESDGAQRAARWAALDHPAVAVVHARGEGRVGAFITSQYPGERCLSQWDMPTSSDTRTQFWIDAVDGLVALAQARLAAADEALFVDDDGRPLFAAVDLSRDGEPRHAIDTARGLAATLDLSPRDIETIDAAEDLDALQLARAQIVDRLHGPHSRSKPWALGLGLAAAVGVTAGVLWPSDDAPREDPCRDAAHAAEHWLETAPTLEGPAATHLETWVEGWSTTAENNCLDAAREQASPPRVQARQRCLDEHLAALRGVWKAYVDHPCTRASCPSPEVLLPPPDACAWGNEETYLHKPWLEHTTSAEVIEQIAWQRATAATGRAVGDEAAAPTDEVSPRWRAWIHDTKAKLAPDDVAWRRASWASFVDAIEAGDELGALRAMVSRAIEAASRDVELHPSPEVLARALAERTTSSYGDTPRVRAWVEAELARLDAAMR